jgi:hypothetical protein
MTIGHVTITLKSGLRATVTADGLLVLNGKAGMAGKPVTADLDALYEGAAKWHLPIPGQRTQPKRKEPR